MINLFQVAPADQSIAYLSQIFGTVNGVLANSTNPQAGAINVLSTMFKTFNSVILVVAVLMLVYITIIGVVSTAHEGEFMGRKMNNIWIPIRAVMGIALLVPTGAGYCLIQIIMMWVIVQGVGAADVLWNTALAYVSVESPYASVSVAGVQTTQVLNGLFQGLVCEASLGGQIPAFTPQTNCPEGGCIYKLENCGALTYCDQNAACASTTSDGSGIVTSNSSSLQCGACTAQISALTQIIGSVMTPIAQSFVAADTSYQNFYKFYENPPTGQNPTPPGSQWITSYCSGQGKSPCCFGKINGQTCATMPLVSDSQAATPADQNSASADAVQNLYWSYWPQLGPALGAGSNFISIAAGQYTDMANAALTSYIQSQGTTLATNNSALSNASKRGWIFAGALYYSIASSSNNALQGSIPVLTWTPPDINSAVMVKKRNNYTAASYLTQAAIGSVSQASSNPQFQSVTASVSSVPNLVGTAFSQNISNQGGNPLVALVVTGQVLLILATVLFTVITAVVLALGIALAAGSIQVLGFGVPEIGYSAFFIETWLIPMAYAGLGLLVTLGGTLAIYTPLLPFIYFTFGAITWMISAVEAMVAGPLVALFIINPKGEHEIMGKAEPALMLLFSIFLRPSLMIFGLMAAMLLATVVVSFINAGFGMVFDTGGMAKYDPLSLILVLCAYVGLVLAGLNTSFKVINLIPQQVMSWIGHQAAGVEAPTDAVKGAVDAGASKAGGAAPTGDAAMARQRDGKREKPETSASIESKDKGKGP